MNIIFVSATELEQNSIWECVKKYKGEHNVFFSTTGVGMTATAFDLGKKLNPDFHDLAINIGLAGAFDRNLKLGEVVNVLEDQFSEEGAEDGDRFISLDEMGLRFNPQITFDDGKLKSSFELKSPDLKKVSGITVNTVHGNEESIQKVKERLNPQVESMEGAAFLYACRMKKIPCLQIRSISNYVEKRNRDNWEIELALSNLSKAVEQILTVI